LRPKYYLHFFYLIKRQFLFNYDSAEIKNKAYQWATANAVPYMDALESLNLKGDIVGLDNDVITEGRKLAIKSSARA
jgi:hypothetical protein